MKCIIYAHHLQRHLKELNFITVYGKIICGDFNNITLFPECKLSTVLFVSMNYLVTYSVVHSQILRSNNKAYK